MKIKENSRNENINERKYYRPKNIKKKMTGDTWKNIKNIKTKRIKIIRMKMKENNKKEYMKKLWQDEKISPKKKWQGGNEQTKNKVKETKQ